MLAYLSKVRDSLRSKLSGMEKNSDVWANQPVTLEEVAQQIKLIDDIDAEVEQAWNLYAVKSAEARKVCDAAREVDVRMANLVKGMYGNNESKLIEYNIKLKKSIAAKQPPSKALWISIEDDSDAEGFIVSTSVDSSADFYEWQKGTNTNAAEVNITPELSIFKTTNKSSFVDNDVQKGVRVFYRVRAGNRRGVGPWSEAASRVQ